MSATPIVLYGGGNLGIQCAHLIQAYLKDVFAIRGFVDDQKSAGTEVLPGLKVLGGKEFIEKASPKDFSVAICIGPTALRARHEIFRGLRERGFEFPNIVHPAARIEPNSKIGVGNLILAGCALDHTVSVGDINYLDVNCSISHNNTIGDNTFVCVGTSTAGFVKIGSHCFIGIDSTITDGVTVGDDCVIHAKGLLTHDLGRGQELYTLVQRRVIDRAY